MESFRSRYVDRCEELGIQPSQYILDKLRPHHGPNCNEKYPDRLDISGTNLTLKACDALSCALADDVVFVRVGLADAWLGDDGCALIASVLKSNSTIEHLDLRGNNIRAEGATALAQALKTNSTLKVLQLEWNCIGIYEQGLRNLAGALAVNQGLRELDLRNNKIGPQAAAALAASIKRNSTLKRLNLKFNNAGMIGGRAFADSLRWNATLIQVDLTGNEVPDDVIVAIEVALDRNKDRHSHVIHTKAHTEHLTSTLQQLTTQHDDTVRSLSSKLTSTGEHATQLSAKLGDAVGEIERSRALERALEARLEELRRQKTESEDCLIMERGETAGKINLMLKELNAERESRARADETHRVQLADATQAILAAEARARDEETKVEILKRDKAVLLEELDRAKSREKAAIKHGEDICQSLETSLTRKFHAQIQAKEDEYVEIRRKYEEKLRAQETERDRAEKEFEAQRAKWLLQKSRFEDEMNNLRDTWKRDEDKRRSETDERLSQALHVRDTLQKAYDEAQRLHASALSDRDVTISKLRDQTERYRTDLTAFKTQLAATHREAQELRKTLESITTEDASLPIRAQKSRGGSDEGEEGEEGGERCGGKNGGGEGEGCGQVEGTCEGVGGGGGTEEAG